jgi:DNA polymerase-3 subunit epsilon
MSKLFFYDLETTGLSSYTHAIHQISGMIVIDGEIKERFDFKVKPHDKALIIEAALKVGNVTEQQIMSYPEMTIVYKELIDMLSGYVSKFDKKDKFHLVGYNNSTFDNPFFRQFFTLNNDKYFGSYFWSDCIDVMVLASNKLKDRRHEMEDFKLKTVAKFLGIEVDESKLHEAGYDIELTKGIYDLVC